MTFDPFGDFETQGYLRNLAKVKRLTYIGLLETHRILFEAVYPWAGQDRGKTAPDLAKGLRQKNSKRACGLGVLSSYW